MGGEGHGHLVYIKYTWSIGNCATWCNIPAPSSCRSFNREWMNLVSQTNCHGLRAPDFSSESVCDQIIHNPIHKSGNCLDLIFTDTPGVIAGNVGIPVGTSDYCYIYISGIIKTVHTMPDITFPHKIYLISQTAWDGIFNNIDELDWADTYRAVDYVASMNDAFERIQVIVRCIPS